MKKIIALLVFLFLASCCVVMPVMLISDFGFLKGTGICLLSLVGITASVFALEWAKDQWFD